MAAVAIACLKTAFYLEDGFCAEIVRDSMDNTFFI